MQILQFFKKNIVLTISLCAALITSLIVTPDKAYLGYYDLKTLTCLFCVLAVICAFRDINFFYILAQKLVRYFRNTRLAILALVYITFIGSMLITNDTALLTFLPLSYFVLHATKNDKYLAFTFIMQNCAANLGGMLTPFGNPQNLYLYTKFNIPNDAFLSIMLPPFVISMVLITVCCLFVKAEPLAVPDQVSHMDTKRAVLYGVLFALAVAIVLRAMPYWIGLVVIPVTLFFSDREALKKVDYPLLLTFVAFFTFAGNMARMESVQQLFSALLQKNTLLFSALSCQVISNVPAAILLSQFTNDYAPLLQGVNIGGAGTLIASLASLITFQEYTRHEPHRRGRFIALFSVFNFAFLFILLAAQMLINSL